MNIILDKHGNEIKIGSRVLTYFSSRKIIAIRMPAEPQYNSILLKCEITEEGKQFNYGVFWRAPVECEIINNDEYIMLMLKRD